MEPAPGLPNHLSKLQNALVPARIAITQQVYYISAARFFVHHFGATPIVACLAPTDGFVERRLVRVRKQLARLDRQLDDALEAQPLNGRLLNDLAAAQSRLADQEQRLASRPLPGSRRPGKERRRPMPGFSAVEPIEPLD